MKKTAAAALVLLGALLAGCSKTETPAPAAATPAPAAVTKIVVGLDDNFPPMGFRDEKNELVGFDIDMAKEAAKRLGLEVEFKPIDWSAKEAELSGKRVDALWNGLTITEERKQNIAFTAPYMENHQIIVVAAGSTIKGKADLAGKVVGAQEGSSAVDAVKKDDAVFKSFKEFKTFGDNVTALMDLSTGRLEAVVVDEVPTGSASTVPPSFCTTSLRSSFGSTRRRIRRWRRRDARRFTCFRRCRIWKGRRIGTRKRSRIASELSNIWRRRFCRVSTSRWWSRG